MRNERAPDTGRICGGLQRGAAEERSPHLDRARGRSYKRRITVPPAAQYPREIGARFEAGQSLVEIAKAVNMDICTVAALVGQHAEKLVWDWKWGN